MKTVEFQNLKITMMRVIAIVSFPSAVGAVQLGCVPNINQHQEYRNMLVAKMLMSGNSPLHEYKVKELVWRKKPDEAMPTLYRIQQVIDVG